MIRIWRYATIKKTTVWKKTYRTKQPFATTDTIANKSESEFVGSKRTQKIGSHNKKKKPTVTDSLKAKFGKQQNNGKTQI